MLRAMAVDRDVSPLVNDKQISPEDRAQELLKRAGVSSPSAQIRSFRRAQRQPLGTLGAIRKIAPSLGSARASGRRAPIIELEE